MLLRIAMALLLAQTAVPADSTQLYYLVFLKPDPARKPLAQADLDRIQAAHMANIQSMADRGVLVAAGPFDDQPITISGIFVFRTASLQEAQSIAAQDPTVIEKRNRADVFPWRGPRGIGDEYFRLHRIKPDTPEDMGVQPVFLLFRTDRSAARAETQSAHDAYLAQWKREGKIAMYGPFEGDAELVGMVVFNRISDEEAQRLMSRDPSVQSHALRAEFHRWWCAAHVMPD